MEATVEQKASTRERLRAPLPPEAIKQHPTKKYLSTVNVAFIIERLNDVFGEDGWNAEYTIIESERMIVVRCDFSAGNIKRIAFGGNENSDRGDSYKGACTDALSKAVSQIGIAQDVYKGMHDAPPASDKQIQVSNGQATVSKSVPKPAVKPVQKTNTSTAREQPKATSLPLAEPNVKAEVTGFVATDDDIPSVIGSKPTKPEMNAYGDRFKALKVDMNKIGNYLRKKFEVAHPSSDLTKQQWEEALKELEGSDAGKLKELVG